MPKLKHARPRLFPALSYRPKDAADALGVSVSTLYGMIARGSLKTVKLGTATVIRHEELVAILETGEPGRSKRCAAENSNGASDQPREVTR